MSLGRIAIGQTTWDDIRTYAGHFFDFWPDGEDRHWLKCCWSVLERHGLTYFNSPSEEMGVRMIPACLALFYQEFLWRLSFQDSGMPDETMAEILAEDRHLIGQALHECRKCLVEHYGEEAFFRYTITSVIAGANQLITFDLIEREAESIMQRLPQSGELPLDRAYEFLLGASLDPYEFESIPNTPKHWDP